MGDHKQTMAQVTLEYQTGEEIAGQVYRNRPRQPDLDEDVLVAVRRDWGPDDDPSDEELRRPFGEGTPQIWVVGTSAGLEALGTFLIALARLDTLDPTPHTHFDVKNADGGTVHLIIRRELQLP
jgi:hypothetical protein